MVFLVVVVVTFSAVGGSLEEGEGKLLVNNTNIEVDESRIGNIDTDALDGEPEEELLLLHTSNASQLPVAKIPSYHSLEVDLILELGIAGLLQVNLQLPLIVQGVGFHPLGEQPLGKAILLQHIVDRFFGLCQSPDHHNHQQQNQRQPWSAFHLFKCKAQIE